MSKLSRRELEFVIEPQVRKFCGPMFLSRSLETAMGDVTANGSFGLVDTGNKKLLVTCYHVWDEFRKGRDKNSDLQMCICLDQRNPVVFAPEEPLGEDRELDIVTFDMEPLLEACGGRTFYPLNQKPARKVAKGDVLFFIGFPGNLRCVIDGALGFGRSPYALRAHSMDNMRFYSDVSNVIKQSEQFGGISGCPCFVVQEDKPIRLAGFATSKWKEFLVFTHARCLNHDGTIDPVGGGARSKN